MTRRIVASTLVAIVLSFWDGASASAEKITLVEALEYAQKHSELALAETQVDAAHGRSLQAGTIAFNPQLSGGIGPRLGGTQTVLDFEVGLSQTLELGDKREHRKASSKALLRAARWQEKRVGQLVFLRVRRSFALAIAARQVLQTTREAEDVSAELKKISTERLEQGAGTMLEVNLAAAGLGRARRRRSQAEQALISAEYELASGMGLPAMTRIEPVGSLGGGGPRLPAIEELLRRSLENRHDLAALRENREAMKASVRLANSLTTPNVSVGASYAHEEGSDQFLATLSIELPVWNRNRGSQAQARANRRQATIVSDYAELELERQVRAAAANYATARKTLEVFEQESVGKLADTLALTQEAFERGKISMLQFNLLRTEFVDVRLAYLEAATEEILARFDLEQAIGGELK